MKNFYRFTNALSILFLLIILPSVFVAQSVNFNYNGNNRTCTVHLPTGYNAFFFCPLVFNLHGYNSNASQQQFYSAMDNVADTAKFIVAYPDAEGGVWDTEFSGSTVDDVGYFNALLDSLLARYSINPQQVYATGMSMGGFMTYRLACEMGHRLRAVASVAGPTVDSLLLLCNSAPILPVMHIHGTTDNTVPYNGTALYNHVDSTVQHFVQRNVCDTLPTVTNIPNVNTNDNCTITTYCYSCYDSNEVLFYKVTGGGHTWPGGLIPIPPFGNTNYDINGSSHIWNFFNRHKPQNVTQSPSLASEATLRVFPNPASAVLQLQLPESITSVSLNVQLVDITGRILQQKQLLYSNHTDLNVEDLAEGIYFVRVLLTGEQVYQSVFAVNRSSVY